MQEFDGESQVDFAEPVVRPSRASRAGVKRYIDTFYRHWVIALIPIIVLPLAAFAVARLSGKSTTATTSIWVNQVSVKQLSYADPLVTPAANTMAAVLQLLQTGAFDMLVARESPAYWNTVS